MHFIKNIIEEPILEDPAQNHMKVHRHFYRYSKGDFLGPALKITKTNTRITLRGSFEYEDLIQEIVVSTIPQDYIDIMGVLITGNDIGKNIESLGLDWKLKKSTGKTINYKVEINETIKKENLIEIIRTFRDTSYLLLSFNLNPTCKVTTKNRIPQPSKKKIDDDNINKRIQFCSGVINPSDKNIDLIVDNALFDFESDLPEKWKNITIMNNYKIKEIIIPKGIQNSSLLRIKAIRKGFLTRIINIDGDLIEKQYSVVV